MKLGKEGFKRAFNRAAEMTLITAGVMTGIGYMTNDFAPLVYATAFAFISSMAIAGQYERLLASEKDKNNAQRSLDKSYPDNAHEKRVNTVHRREPQ
ncbi:MAG: hypothetical protein KME37_09650 [Candidatus Thiodiazotropha sp. (ex Codakia orbicularis)]|nr:hypothetical protein [Candidatus Thiodiazotropha sp. (ex Codakia orbicularis)]